MCVHAINLNLDTHTMQRFPLILAPTYRAANRCVPLIVLRELLNLRRPYAPR